MENLIVYYSYEGNTYELVNGMLEVIKADVVRLVPKGEKKSKSLYRFIWGAKEVYMTRKPELEEYHVDLDKYDNIIICSPCWFGSYAPPINTFLTDNKFKNKNVYLLMCDGNNLRNTWKNYDKALEGNNIVSRIDFVYPKKKGLDKAIKNAQDWIKSYLG